MDDIITPEKGRIRVEITASDGNLITVQRQHPSGRLVTVRGMDLAPLSDGAFIGWDYEAPIGVELIYHATAYVDADTVLATSELDTITWTTENEWLKDPLEPIRNMPVRIVDMSEYDYATPTGVFPVLGRPDPVTVAQIRTAATGDVTLLTLDDEERDRMHYLTASGHTLLLQSSQSSGVGNMYISVLGVKEQRAIYLRDHSERLWTLTYQEVGAPVGDATAFSNWQDMLNTYATWQAVTDANESWLQAIEGLDSTSAPPILTWRGA